MRERSTTPRHSSRERAEPSSHARPYSAEWSSNLIGQLLAGTHEGPERLRQVLDEHALKDILCAAGKLLGKEPTVLEVAPSKGKPVFVVGDTHGQFHDVLHMLEQTKCGEGYTDKYMIFNGDYVDRGAWGVELLLAVLSLKLAYPQNVFLLRGNHEGSYCTRYYGFQQEVTAKYPRSACKTVSIIKAFLDVFKVLPVAAVVANSTLIVHGGLWRKPVLPSDTRTKAQKRKHHRMQTDAVDSEYALADGSDAPLQVGTLADLRATSKGGLDPLGQHKSNLLATDALWSDPRREPGLDVNVTRSLGLTFGPDITEDFLRTNSLRLVVRSHEGPDARWGRDDMPPMSLGYTVDHNTPAGKLVTVFSAPDYPQFQVDDERFDNQASVLKLLGPSYSEYKVVTYSAVPRPANASCYYDLDIPGSDAEMQDEDGDNAPSGGSSGSDADTATPAAAHTALPGAPPVPSTHAGAATTLLYSEDTLPAAPSLPTHVLDTAHAVHTVAVTTGPAHVPGSDTAHVPLATTPGAPTPAAGAATTNAGAALAAAVAEPSPAPPSAHARPATPSSTAHAEPPGDPPSAALGCAHAGVDSEGQGSAAHPPAAAAHNGPLAVPVALPSPAHACSAGAENALAADAPSLAPTATPDPAPDAAAAALRGAASPVPASAGANAAEPGQAGSPAGSARAEASASLPPGAEPEAAAESRLGATADSPPGAQACELAVDPSLPATGAVNGT